MADAQGATAGTITLLLERARAGDKPASDELFQRVYAELRHVARAMVTREGWPRSGMEGTALVHAACERLLGKQQLDAENRRHFFFLFGRAMHDVLVERAREELALKRGGGRQRVPMVEFAADGDVTRTSVLDLHEALRALREEDPRTAQVVELRYFGSRTLEQIAEMTGHSLATVRRDWEAGRAWLQRRLSGPPKAPDAPPSD